MEAKEFDLLMAAIGKSRCEIAKICDKKLSAQAVSWWRASGRILPRHLNKLASELCRQIENRPMTQLDERAFRFLAKKGILEVRTGGPYV